jgi:hypothetical protein
LPTTSIGLSNVTQVYTGGPLSPTVTTNPAGLTYSWSVVAPNVSVLQTNAGSYSVMATLTDPNYLGGSASGTFVIFQATVTAVITAVTNRSSAKVRPVPPVLTLWLRCANWI